MDGGTGMLVEWVGYVQDFLVFMGHAVFIGYMRCIISKIYVEYSMQPQFLQCEQQQCQFSFLSIKL